MTGADGVPRQTAYVVGPFGAATRTAGRDSLPYGAHHLREHGYAVTYSDPSASYPIRVARLSRPLRVVHRLFGKPVLAPVLEPIRLLRANLVVSIFEDNISALTWVVRLRSRLPGRDRRMSVLVVCWLAEDIHRMTARERRRWRRRLSIFDRVLVFSSNQVDLLRDGLELRSGLVTMVPFGVTVPVPDRQAPPAATHRPTAGLVLSVGTDRGRDFQTFVAALSDFPAPVTVVTNAEHAGRLRDTGGIRVYGPIERSEYLSLLNEAEVVVCPSLPFAYPTGQTVLLEALASGRPCVVTRSAALDDYVTDGVDVKLVPAGDPAALRAAVDELRSNATLRASLSRAARKSGAQFTEARMWSAIVAASAQRVDPAERHGSDRG